MSFLSPLLLLMGCGASSTSQDTSCVLEDFSYPRDSQLRFSDLQALGTHNSYHVETTEGQVNEWEYTHAPLGTQLLDQGIRQFELDLYFNSLTGALDVLHVPYLDPGSNCPTLEDCVQEIARFSRRNPAHHPLMVLLEFKSSYSETESDLWLSRAETVLENQLGKDRLVLPSEVRGSAANLKEAIAESGWPSLGALRGKSLFVLHDGGSLRSRYVETIPSDQWLLFPDARGNLDLDFAAIHAVNDPIGSFDRIQELVTANHMVRTRADSDLKEGRSQDTARLMHALESGAHFVSTDFPVPQADIDYVVTIPEGTPSRCNPLSTSECTSEDLENPAFIGTCD